MQTNKIHVWPWYVSSGGGGDDDHHDHDGQMLTN